MEIGRYNYDEDLISSVMKNQASDLRIYRIDHVAVVLGHGSNPEVEVNVDSCMGDGIPILRRRGGGCAVVLDPGNAIVSLVIPADGPVKIREYFKSISSWLIEGLGKCGVERVRHDGISDLVVDDQKIAGACMQRKRDFVFYSVSILVNPDVELMERYLKHPPREPSYRKGRSHRDFAGSLEKLFGIGDVDSFIKELSENLNVGDFYLQ